jgi:hypothetical protein
MIFPVSGKVIAHPSFRDFQHGNAPISTVQEIPTGLKVPMTLTSYASLCTDLASKEMVVSMVPDECLFGCLLWWILAGKTRYETK